MPAAKPGDIWTVDLGMAAKVRPCLILTAQPKSHELDVFTVNFLSDQTLCFVPVSPVTSKPASRGRMKLTLLSDLSELTNTQYHPPCFDRVFCRRRKPRADSLVHNRSF